IGKYGFTALFAAGPLVAIIFATCHFYFKQADEREKAHQQRIEAAMSQAEQAERHLAELQESEERFRSAFDYAAIGMALVAPDGKWLQVNRSLCGIIGYSEQELCETDFQTITHDEDLQTVVAHIGKVLDGDIPNYPT